MTWQEENESNSSSIMLSPCFVSESEGKNAVRSLFVLTLPTVKEQKNAIMAKTTKITYLDFIIAAASVSILPRFKDIRLLSILHLPDPY